MKGALTIAALICLTVALGAGWYELHGVLIIGFFAFCLLLFTANLDRISEIKASGSGIEAKTRDVLRRAETTVSELQSLARLVSEATLSLIKRTGRFGEFPDEEAERIKDGLLSVLDDIGVSKSDQESALKEWHRLTCFDYVIHTLGQSRIPQGFGGNEIITEWKALRSYEQIPSPDTIRTFLQKWGLLDSEREGYIQDYEYYLAHKEHRRPEVWKDRESWPSLEKP